MNASAMPPQQYASNKTADGTNQKSHDHLSTWVHCIAVVTFDLELGQALEHCYPSNIQLSDAEKANVCYLAFPDSNTGCMGDTQYCFRIRKSVLSTPQSFPNLLQTKCPSTLLRDSTHYHGYVYFRQVSDKSVKRGFFQKSVVLLSSLPYFTFFQNIVKLIAKEYFDHGISSLETVCNEIKQWSLPVSGQMIHLSLLGTNHVLRIPSTTDSYESTTMKTNLRNAESISECELSPLNEADLFRCLHELLPHVQLLWELVVLGEPLVVFAPSPSISSATVLALISIIQPLKYHCDFRPYFTIHDSEFKDFTSKEKNVPRVLIGVTNPFFNKTLQHWPHVIKVKRADDSGRRSSLTNTSSQANQKRTHLPDSSTSGVYTKYKTFLKKDSKFTKIFLKGLISSKNGGVEENQLLKRYFLELTQSFMIPLERYLASLMPLQKFISPLKAPPSLKPFDIDELMESIETNGPQLTSGIKGDWIGLYQRFLRSANFEHWFRRRRREMKAKVVSLHLNALSETDLSSWCGEKSEVEVVDMVLRLRKKIHFVDERGLDVTADTVERLETQIKNVIATLPDDLQDILLKNKNVTS